VRVTAGAGISFPSHNAGSHNGGPGGRTSDGTSRGGGCQTGLENGDCRGWWSGGDKVSPAAPEKLLSGQESGRNAGMELH
jgi:hypothetical protein